MYHFNLYADKTFPWQAFACFIILLGLDLRILENMAAELVAAATNEKLEEIDWMKNIEICELVSRDPGYVFYLILA